MYTDIRPRHFSCDFTFKRVSLVMHSIQIHKVISMITSVFYVIGIWHSGDKPTVKERRVKLFYCVFYVLFVISLGVEAITNENMDNSILLAEASIGHAVLALKLWILIWKQNEILDLLDRVCVFSIQNENDNNHYNDKLRSFAKFVLVFMIALVLTGSLSTILPFLGSERTLLLEIAFPLDWKNNQAAFWIVIIFLFAGVVLALNTVFFTIIIWYLLLVCSLRYEVLGNELKNMGRMKEKGKNKVTEREMQTKYFEDLKALIDVHILIRELTSEVEAFLADIFFVQFGTSGLCICGSIYCLAFDVGDNPWERLVFILAFFYFLSDIFMITYFGNEIMLSSDGLFYSLFESDWIEQPQSTKKCLIIFGEYLKKPQELVVGKLYPLTLETFTRILNSAYSMFNILKSFQQ